MAEMTGETVIDENGIMQKGLIIRHLVMPSGGLDSINLLDWIGENIPDDKFMISLMSQYSPEFYTGDDRVLRRRVTSFEYDSVVAEADRLGFDGYMQARASSGTKYTPEFGEHMTVDASCRGIKDKE